MLGAKIPFLQILNGISAIAIEFSRKVPVEISMKTIVGCIQGHATFTLISSYISFDNMISQYNL